MLKLRVLNDNALLSYVLSSTTLHSLMYRGAQNDCGRISRPESGMGRSLARIFSISNALHYENLPMQ